jgi:LmbE family N-acetylglucosaminyl deacetylase
MKQISRRVLFANAVSAAAAGRLSAHMSAVEEASPKKKLKVVVTGGHPGDPEYGCGGTIARYTDAGHEVVLLYLNRGEKNCSSGPGNDSEPRVKEAKKACSILHARAVFAAQCDGNAIIDHAHYEEFQRLIEAEHPDVVFTHWPIDNHRDHRAISNLTYDAWIKAGKRSAFYYYEVSNGEDTLMFEPSDYVDISTVESRKLKACYAHASQAPDRFWRLQSDVTRYRGLEIGYKQAEGFVRHVQSQSNLLP